MNLNTVSPTALIAAEVMNERRQQDEKHGGPEHDDKHFLGEWQGFIRRHLDRASGELPTIRKQLIRVAALAVAAVEALDRYAARH